MARPGAEAPLVRAQVFRTEIISRRLNKTATWPLMASALATVAAISIGAAAVTHPAVSALCLLGGLPSSTQQLWAP